MPASAHRVRPRCCDLPEFVADLGRRGFAGFTVTHPCKRAIIPLLSGCAPEARELGANTDWLGFREGLLRGLPNVSGPRADAHAVVLMAALVNED